MRAGMISPPCEIGYLIWRNFDEENYVWIESTQTNQNADQMKNTIVHLLKSILKLKNKRQATIETRNPSLIRSWTQWHDEWI